MKELYIIRHGETELNRLGIVQGRGVNADLNDTGIAQAAAFFNKYSEVKFDKIYTSSLKRTHQTVKGFIELGLPWEQLDGLDELAWGEWEGKPNTEEAREAFREVVRQWQLGNYNAKFEGGESPNEVGVRLSKAIAHIKKQDNEKCVLICMHGRAMRLILCILLNKPFSDMEEFPHSNTTLYRLQFDGEKFTLLDSNNTSHLEQIL
ncbi:histidine phosphatase family protein [Pedobacter sp.]|uniref:histidine phosphatase family protein n=1 Tax=Pedobacter sp. TaxID=1411316 RepID=UPI0031D110B4